MHQSSARERVTNNSAQLNTKPRGDMLMYGFIGKQCMLRLRGIGNHITRSYQWFGRTLTKVSRSSASLRFSSSPCRHPRLLSIIRVYRHRRNSESARSNSEGDRKDQLDDWLDLDTDSWSMLPGYVRSASSWVGNKRIRNSCSPVQQRPSTQRRQRGTHCSWLLSTITVSSTTWSGLPFVPHAWPRRGVRLLVTLKSDDSHVPWWGLERRL
jgi:hypothetical protein